MRRSIPLPVALSVLACAHGPPSPGMPASIALGEDLRVERILPGIWLHVSTLKIPRWGVVPSNGLIVSTPQGTALIDTPWNDRQTRQLLRWMKGSLSPLSLAVVTHAHQDRMGGLRTLQKEGVKVHALDRTVQRLKTRGLHEGVTAFSDVKELVVGERRMELFYPGAGHAPDNIVVWLPGRKVLYAACLVKSLGTDNLGSTADADLGAWPAAINRIKSRYPGARRVIPGHGRTGDAALLDHTLGLLEKPRRYSK